MSEFMLFRPKDSLGPTFKEVAQKLEAENICVKRTLEGPEIGMIIIETDASKARDLSDRLNGWQVGPNYKTRAC